MQGAFLPQILADMGLHSEDADSNFEALHRAIVNEKIAGSG